MYHDFVAEQEAARYVGVAVDVADGSERDGGGVGGVEADY